MTGGDLDILIQSAVGVLGGGGALVGVGLMLRNYFRKMGLDDASADVARMRFGAESDILKSLRDEVTRLAQMNSMLSGEIAVLQAEIIALRRENVALKDEIEKLNDEIERLSRGRRCDECPHNPGGSTLRVRPA